MTQEIKTRIKQIQNSQVPGGYKKTKVGTVPCEWDIKNLGLAVKITNNERCPISENERKTIVGEYPYYGPTQVQGYLNTYKSEGLAVLIGEDGDHFLKYKDKSMTLLVDGKYTVNNHAHIIRGSDMCNALWFNYFFKNRSIFDSLTRQGAGRYKLTKEALLKILIPLPSLLEQEKIAEVLTMQDAIIELKEKRIAEKEKQKKYLMQNLLTGKIRLAGFSGEWEKVKLEDCLRSGSKEPVADTTAYKKITIKLNFKGVEFSTLNREMADTRPFYVRYEGEIIIGKQNYFSGSIAIITNEFSGAICSNAIMSFLPANVNTQFLYNYLSQRDFIEKRSHLANGTGQKELSEKDFLDFNIILPSLPEQNAIAEILSTADKEIELLKKDLDAEKEKKKSLMQLLLTGIVRV